LTHDDPGDQAGDRDVDLAGQGRRLEDRVVAPGPEEQAGRRGSAWAAGAPAVVCAQARIASGNSKTSSSRSAILVSSTAPMTRVLVRSSAAAPRVSGMVELMADMVLVPSWRCE
jgi:hypothetical protein